MGQGEGAAGGWGAESEKFVAINMGNWPKLLQIERVYIGLGGNQSRPFLLNPILNLKFLAEHIKKTYTTS